MEGTESTSRERTAGGDGKQDVDSMVLLSNKPLHRFVRKEPRSFGIVLVIFGCAEILMGFHLGSEDAPTSQSIYIPFWQGFLFVVCGSLSIHTEIHPSKKMVTTCLAMYVISLLGIIVSGGFRISCILQYQFLTWFYHSDHWDFYRAKQISGIEGLLLTSSLCALALLIFLCVITSAALRSTRTQVLVQHIAAPQRDTTSN
ncbi:membrane-spanning 4-domains subfamily A member 4D-like [Cheilinus undulatus]|uniref:membrane-spanning 4-domains subfamily A member 4D-like n=1 Tax=Cheilinus undulatus TaxID=241271 RepID=UPI001BD626C8|nr:membrane-spanning 4-domains subfamily A member 4D-like [Cheilinus undulatus]XP_041645982.1 membrane-spanning 4-domains subfamily A member 4D-like [Cheilinus undulatus]